MVVFGTLRLHPEPGRSKHENGIPAHAGGPRRRRLSPVFNEKLLFEVCIFAKKLDKMIDTRYRRRGTGKKTLRFPSPIEAEP